MVLFQAEKNVKSDFKPFLQRVFITAPEKIDPFFPGKLFAYTGVSAKKMIGNDDTGIAAVLIVPCVLLPRADSAGTCLAGMHMSFIKIGHSISSIVIRRFFPSVHSLNPHPVNSATAQPSPSRTCTTITVVLLPFFRHSASAVIRFPRGAFR